MIALVLGAGFSKWAANLPIASQLFDFDIEPFGIREQRRLNRVFELKQKWDLDNDGGLAEQFLANMLEKDLRSRRDVTWYVVRRLSDPYIWKWWQSGRIRRNILMIDEYRKWRTAGIKKAADFLHAFGMHLYGIVTLNYDLLVEYALGSGGFNYGCRGETLLGRGPYFVYTWRKSVTLSGNVRLAKLHGSVSWDGDGRRYTDGRRGLIGDALIVPPAPEKQPPSSLMTQWDLSNQIFKAASRIVVFGFGFNQYDRAVLSHFREAGRSLTEAALVDIQSREDEAAALWPQVKLSSFPPSPEGIASLRHWLNRAAP